MHLQTRLSFLLPSTRTWEWGYVGLHLYISSNTVCPPEIPKEVLIFWVLLFKDLGFHSSRYMCIECRTHVLLKTCFTWFKTFFMQTYLYVWLSDWSSQSCLMWPMETSLVPRPHPPFCRFQYCKVGRAWCLFSCEHDVIRKWRKFAEQAMFCVFWTDYKLNARCVRQLPSLARHVW